MKDKILALLKNSTDYISGEELSFALGITRSAIWKYMKALRTEGYTIDSVTNKGYKLLNSDGVFNTAEVKEGLKTHSIGKELVCLQTIDSTNDEVKRLAAKGASHGLVVAASEQTKGKGRLGRVWQSPNDGSIAFSILVRPDIAPNEVAVITLVAGLGVCKAIRSYTGCNAKIKWPNDIIIENKKVCGILTEMSAEADKINYAVIGIGINVNNSDFSPDIIYKATSLALATGHKLSRADFLKEVLYQIEIVLDDYFIDFNSNVLKEYTSLCATIGRKVMFERNRKKYSGKADGIGTTGELRVNLDDGKSIYVGSGEVTVQGIY